MVVIRSGMKAFSDKYRKNFIKKWFIVICGTFAKTL